MWEEISIAQGAVRLNNLRQNMVKGMFRYTNFYCSWAVASPGKLGFRSTFRNGHGHNPRMPSRIKRNGLFMTHDSQQSCDIRDVISSSVHKSLGS